MCLYWEIVKLAPRRRDSEADALVRKPSPIPEGLFSCNSFWYLLEDLSGFIHPSLAYAFSSLPLSETF